MVPPLMCCWPQRDILREKETVGEGVLALSTPSALPATPLPARPPPVLPPSVPSVVFPRSRPPGLASVSVLLVVWSSSLGLGLALRNLFASSRFLRRSSTLQLLNLARPPDLPAFLVAPFQSLAILFIAPTMFRDPFLGAHCSLTSAVAFPGFLGGKPDIARRRRRNRHP